MIVLTPLDKNGILNGATPTHTASSAPGISVPAENLPPNTTTNSRPRHVPSDGAPHRSFVAGRRPSLSGGAPPWAPANRKVDDSRGGTGSTTAAPGAERRASLSGGLPRWAPASSSTNAAPVVGRRPSLSGGMPRWAPEPAQAAGVTAVVVRLDDQGAGQERGSDAGEKTGKLAASEVRVSGWLAAAAGAGSGEVRTRG